VTSKEKSDKIPYNINPAREPVLTLRENLAKTFYDFTACAIMKKATKYV